MGEALVRSKSFSQIERNALSVCLLIGLGGCDAGRTEQGTGPDTLVASVPIHLVSDSVFDVRDARIQGDHIWVLSSFDPLVHVFSTDGDIVSSFGRRTDEGDGYLSLVSIVGSGGAGEEAEFWDVTSRAAVRLDRGGAVRASTDVSLETGRVVAPFTEVSFGDPGRVARLSGFLVADVYARNVLAPVDLWSGRLAVVSDGSARLGVRFVDLTDRERSRGEFEVFEGLPLWNVCEARNEIMVFNPDSSRLHRFSPDGLPLGVKAVSLPTREVNSADVRRYVQRRLERMGPTGREVVDTTSPEVRREIRETVSALESQLPRTGPAVSLECDADGRVWIQLFGTDSDARGFGSHWLVLSEGDQDRVVRFPERFQPLHFGADWIVGLIREDFGVTKPAIVAVPMIGG